MLSASLPILLKYNKMKKRYTCNQVLHQSGKLEDQMQDTLTAIPYFKKVVEKKAMRKMGARSNDDLRHRHHKKGFERVKPVLKDSDASCCRIAILPKSMACTLQN
jgi:hypothetical protein